MRRGIVVFLLLTIGKFSYADCDNEMWWFANNGIGIYTSNLQGGLGYAYFMDQGLNEVNCSRNYNDDYISHTVKIRGKIGGSWGVWHSGYDINTYLPVWNDQWHFEDKIAGCNYLDIRNAEELQVQIDYIVDAMFGTNVLHVQVNCYGVGNAFLMENILCSSKEYTSLDDFITITNGLTDRSVKIDDSESNLLTSPDISISIPDFGSFSSPLTVSQPFNGIIWVLYTGKRNGKEVRRRWKRYINPVKEAYFVSTVQSGGAVTSQTPSSPMSDYISTNGGVLEYSGSGLIVNSGNYYFSPSTANVGNNVMFVRTDNLGCKSYWHDTIFYITPIVTSINVPTILPQSGFGAGETGLFYAKNTTGVVTLDGKFHFGCSDRNYTFTLGSYQTGVTYEWQVLFHNQIHASGTGNSFTFTMPNRADVNVDQSSSVYSVQEILQDPVNHYFNSAIQFGNGEDIDGSGAVDAADALVTINLGDEMKVMCRGVNVFNAVSDWNTLLVGVVPTPELEDNSVLCYSGNPILNPVTETPVYLSAFNPSSIRSTLWDVNNDGSWELNGSVDSVLQFMTVINKSDLMRSQIIDSTKLYAYNSSTGLYYDVYSPLASEVCFSAIDTVNIVRLPIFSTSFSVIDSVSIGTPVRGIVNGQWFSVDNDSIVWSWSDDSPNYFGDTVWHFMNDLGVYSLDVTVIDSFGCQSSQNFMNQWFVPGVLSEQELANNEINIYPVPVIDILKIETNNSIALIEILDVNGKIVLESNVKETDLSMLKSGFYYVRINFENTIVTKKITKL